MIDGMINVYKEAGYTSHDVVAKLRGILHQKKIGHTGTLDPEAVGVLPVCLGRGTRLCDMLTDMDKTYEAEVRLGMVTDTQDMTGTILEEREVRVSPQEITGVVESFLGEQMQIPPMYSAVKVGGRKLYELAREGKEIERKARCVTFHSIRILDMDFPRFRMEVTCSKGTYIRTLCHDIGQKLGCGGAMEKLVRTRVGRFSLEDSLTLAQIEARMQEGTLDKAFYTLEDLLSEYPAVFCEASMDKLLHNGNPLPVNLLTGEVREGWIRVYDSEQRFIAIYAWKENTGKYFPVKMFDYSVKSVSPRHACM